MSINFTDPDLAFSNGREVTDRHREVCEARGHIWQTSGVGTRRTTVSTRCARCGYCFASKPTPDIPTKPNNAPDDAISVWMRYDDGEDEAAATANVKYHNDGGVIIVIDNGDIYEHTVQAPTYAVAVEWLAWAGYQDFTVCEEPEPEPAPPTLPENIAAMVKLCETVGDYEVAHDIARKFTCEESDAVAAGLRAAGLADEAANWEHEHALTDDEGDDHEHPAHCATCAGTI